MCISHNSSMPCSYSRSSNPAQKRRYIKRILLSGVSENEVKRTLNTDGIFAYLAVVSVSLSALYSTAAVVTPAASSTKHSIQDITKTCLYSHSRFRIIPLCEFYQNPFQRTCAVMKQFTSFAGEAKYSDLYLESNLALCAVRLSADDHCTTHSFC